VRRPPAVARVLERVTSTAREHLMFLPGQTVLVAVSGGPDSVCMVESLVRLRRLFTIRLEVFHFDHRLRKDSALDAAYVARLSARHALPFHLRAATSSPPKGASVEAWARDQRHFAIAEVTRETGVAKTAIGHTMDDQAETVLIGLITGSGIQGMSGIGPVTGTWVNPLIDVTRQEIEAFCRSLHLRPRTDPTNADTRFLRNGIRLRGLPVLERAVGRSLREPLARTAAGLREDADELMRQMFEVVDDVSEQTPDGAVLFAARLLDLPRAIAGRVVAHVVYACGVPCSRADVLAILDLAAGRPGRRRDLSSGLKARRDREYVRLSRPSPLHGENDPPRPGKGKT
jgi:tRNA(Ile)-lysidine synthase